MWLFRLSERYSRPITELECLTPDQLGYEIAVMLADTVRQQAKAFNELTGRDGNRQRVKMLASHDWMDKLIVELAGKTKAAD